MSQVTHGIRSILSHPAIYDLTQNILGAGRSRKKLVKDYIRAEPRDQLLDIGCGTAELLPYLPEDIDYVGFDLSPRYIEAARKRYGARARFECMDIADFDDDMVKDGADIVLAIGILHHLDDELAHALIDTAWSKLRPGGRLITLDGTLTDSQSGLARSLILRDRGQNIRSPEGYRALAGTDFSSVHLTVREDMLFVPYTHCIMECTR
ncbi:class I SAM-dependent methyltransferase [Pseudoxanthomonas sp. PXM01]|uniref:class I SAM-dependent methyltransferase n=1 Tax=Pseudoxanthomonas sp. PXM01 TaxID=2769295 RepID=UPI001786327B|nr:class I SAM-dependent methyltransferase [Pseudoxanthomonas sp. PXM01]MBD9468871.1 class I SAM-dependent methyltransferase [Pseudoxanthomonas sp. PXM01]